MGTIVGHRQVALDDLTLYTPNPRQGDIGAIIQSLEAHGQYRPVVVNKPTMQVLAGNHTVRAARHLGWPKIAVTFVDVDEEEARRIVLVDNRTNDLAVYDDDILVDLLTGLADTDKKLAGTGFDGDDLDDLIIALQYGGIPDGKAGLQERFVVPPFSVLDGRQGYWKQRKDQWISLGILGGEGREHLRTTVAQGSVAFARRWDNKHQQGSGSVFDPVLTEVAYRWFCPPEGHILDPFAGGTTRGAVAAVLGYHYTGIELRQEQVDANQKQMSQADELSDVSGTTRWFQGDSATLPTGHDNDEAWQTTVWEDHPYDLIFTSPPYYDLEAYSDDQLDGSAIPSWDDFVTWYTHLFGRAVDLLADDRFLVIQVGEIRNKKNGTYRNLVGTTIDVLTRLGMSYYNEAVHILPLGSLPVRTAAQFPIGRKLGKGHQNILIFYKGDTATIKDTWPRLDDVHVGPLPEPDPGTD